MNPEMTQTLVTAGALLLGGALGVGFGALQYKAISQDQERQKLRGLRRWMVMPSSFRRIFYLVTALLIVQVVCPLLFRDPRTPWIVSAGIIVGYGWTLVKRLGSTPKRESAAIPS